MTRIKYVVHPGWVISQSDGQRHWVGYPRLVRLYGVNPKECIDAQSQAGTLGFSTSQWAKLKHLFPSRTGNYTLREDSNG